MIKKILCMSRSKAKAIKNKILLNNYEDYDNVFCISIHGSLFIDGEDDGGELFDIFERDNSYIYGVNRVLSLEFDDVAPDTVVRYVNEAQFMNVNQANLIINRVLAWDQIDGNNVLIIHCAAGLNRSGSVTRFCGYLLSIEKETMRDNPYILHNNWVTYLLFAEYFKRIKSDEKF